MKVAILAGGRGQRFGSLTDNLPKPLISVAGFPIVQHVMDIFAAQGHRDFVLGVGYRANDVIDYFTTQTPSQNGTETPQVQFSDAGLHATKTRRLLEMRPLLQEGPFLMTYCDGLADIDIDALVAFHQSHGRLVTVTATHARERFGILELDGDAVAQFDEKPVMTDKWINGGFFVIDPKVFDLIDDPDESWECSVLQRLIGQNQVMAYRHSGFWRCMDTPKDHALLEEFLMSQKLDIFQKEAAE